MEFLEGGDLDEKIIYAKKKKLKFPEIQIWKYLIQILIGIQQLNEKKIIHRDIKPANIFLTKNFQRVKIGDMNISKVMKNDLTQTAIGTPYYLAPEIWDRKKYDEKIDIFSLGCCIFELATLEHPYNAKNSKELCMYVKNKETPDLPFFYSGELDYFVKKCMQKDPSIRPNSNELLKNSVLLRKLKDYGLQGFLEQNMVFFSLLDTIEIPDMINNLNFYLPGDNNKKEEVKSKKKTKIKVRTNSLRVKKRRMSRNLKKPIENKKLGFYFKNEKKNIITKKNFLKKNNIKLYKRKSSIKQKKKKIYQINDKNSKEINSTNNSSIGNASTLLNKKYPPIKKQSKNLGEKKFNQKFYSNPKKYNRKLEVKYETDLNKKYENHISEIVKRNKSKKKKRRSSSNNYKKKSFF